MSEKEKDKDMVIYLSGDQAAPEPEPIPSFDELKSVYRYHEINGDTATVTREVDGGLEIISLRLPAIVTTDLRLNEPRYVTLPNIMKAKKKTIKTVKPADFGIDPSPRLKTLKVVEPPVRKAGVKVPDVATLIEKLKTEAKVI